MTDEGRGSFERALATLAERLDSYRKVLAALQGTVRRAQSAARTGHVREIERRIADIRDRAAEVDRATGDVAGAWDFDLGPYLEQGHLLEDLKDAAATAGVQIFERDGRVYAFPVLLRIDAGDRSVRISGRTERRLRPEFLAGLLAAAQNRRQRFAAPRFLELLYKTYQQMVGRSGQQGDEVVRLTDIHDRLTLFPGTDYPLEEFARDLHLLARQPDLRTRDGRRFEFTGSTLTKGTGRRIGVVDEDGKEHLYVGIRFSRDT